MSKTTPQTQSSPTRHTPGPLTVIRVPVREGALQHEDAMDRNTIAFLGMVLDGTQYDRLYVAAEQAHPDECFAMEENAARLALCWNSHDDLLAVCRLAVHNEETADGLRGSGMVDDVDIKALRAVAKAARAAIAKATGGVA